MSRAVARGLCAGFLGVSLVLGLRLDRWISGSESGLAWYESARLFPLLAITLVALGALAQLLRLRGAARAAGGDDEADAEVDARGSRGPLVAAGVAGLVAMALLTGWIGFVPSVVVVAGLLAHAAGLGARRALVFALVLATLLHLVFVLGFDVWFPAPRVLELIG
ncbi:tripartite tricarboxylate transporter TctB family protein [Caldimonas tepidiphila]|uniref:tripartite tricarboxylate transporter TctB family protein n=1 Tax=Caldimonas tepidiphila TaxID=2315841 RepID=UPI0013006C66|nr:tripartite tricarboxylate transporter TctB family protein [Caldimonas tepidiphila]